MHRLLLDRVPTDVVTPDGTFTGARLVVHRRDDGATIAAIYRSTHEGIVREAAVIGDVSLATPEPGTNIVAFGGGEWRATPGAGCGCGSPLRRYDPAADLAALDGA